MVAVTARIFDWLLTLPPYDGLLPPAVKNWHVLLVVVLVVLLLPPALNTASWLLWIVVSIVFGLGRAFYTAFIVVNVAVDIWLLSAMKTVHTLYRYVRWCVRARVAV